jgi:hypothetical protein
VQDDVESFLQQSQREDPHPNVSILLQGVQQERRRRSSRQQEQQQQQIPPRDVAPGIPEQQPQQQDSNEQDSSQQISRWGPAKSNSVVQAKNTLRANTTAINAFKSWLVSTQRNNTPPVDLPKKEFLQLLAEFVLVVSCMEL